MLKSHEVAYWPFKIAEGQAPETDRIIHEARVELEKIIVAGNEDPTEYLYDVLSDKKPIKVGVDQVTPHGIVKADTMIAGVVVAWRKGTTKPKISGDGRMG